jgi:hypothetical protein
MGTGGDFVAGTPRARDERDERRMSRRRRVADDNKPDDDNEPDDTEPEEDYDEYEDEDGARELSAPLAAQVGLRHVEELTGKSASGVTSLERVDDGWKVGVEVVEDRRIPSSTDILAIYNVQISADGSLESYQRARRYQRGRGDRESEVI